MIQSEGPSSRLAVFVGATRGIGMTTLVVHLGAFFGVRAQLKTLLLDLSPNGTTAMELLGIQGPSLLKLVQPWLERERIETEELGTAISPYRPILPNGQHASQLDVLLGYRDLSEPDAERLRAYRGMEFIDCVRQAARDAGYQVLLAEVGTLPVNSVALELLSLANWVFVVGGREKGNMLEVLEKFDQRPSVVAPEYLGAIVRESDSPWRGKSELATRAGVRAFFLPWQKSEGLGDAQANGLARGLAQPDSNPYFMELRRIAGSILQPEARGKRWIDRL